MSNYETVSVGQINILNGIEGSVERYKLLAESLLANPMDIVAIQEISCPDELVSIMKEIGYSYHVKTQMFFNGRATWDCLAIFSKNEIEEIEFINSHERALIGGRVKIKNTVYNVFSAHLSWGPQNAYDRLKQVSLIDKVSAVYEKSYPGSVSILCGDLNTDPESRPIRFLKGWDLGDDNKTSTLWMDAYSEAGDETNWTTSDHANNVYGIRSALMNGVIDTDFIPKRRIDYIFSRGWLYGKSGYPVEFGYLEHPEKITMSDHNGIYARLLVM